MDKQSAPDDAVTPLASDPVAPPGKALNGASGGDVAVRLTLPAQAGMFGWLTNHPTGFWFFFWGELAERSCFYGMRAILFLYLAKGLGYRNENASTINHLFIAACYLLPLLGGYVADNYLGKYWTIVGFSVPYIIGQLCLCFDSGELLGIPPHYFVFFAAAGDGQRRHQTEHLDADGPDLRSGTAGQNAAQ